MLTIVVILSGPQRLQMLEQTLGSIPLESARIAELHIVTRGAPWDWAPALRARFESHAKVRIFEEADDLPWPALSSNRAFRRVTTPWLMQLHDDDWLLPRRFDAALSAMDDPRAADAGFIAFGWYRAQRGRFEPESADLATPAGMFVWLPKYCATLFNTARLREIGYIDNRFLGFNDVGVFLTLRYRFGALATDVPVGVFRIHGGQISGSRLSFYLPGIGHSIDCALRYTRDGEQARRFIDAIRDFTFSRRRLSERVRRRLASIRGLRAPQTEPVAPTLTYWAPQAAREDPPT